MQSSRPEKMDEFEVDEGPVEGETVAGTWDLLFKRSTKVTY
jgi:hypothetical protein